MPKQATIVVLEEQFMLYSNPYSNTGKHQRFKASHHGKKSAISSTRKTGANAERLKTLACQPLDTGENPTHNIRYYFEKMCK